MNDTAPPRNSKLRPRVDACLRQGRFAEAEQACRAALENDPEDPDARGLLGIVKLKAQQPAVAAEWLRDALSATPDDTNLSTALAEACYRLGQHERARELLHRVLGRAPGSVTALHLLGVIDSALGNDHEAFESLERALELKPSNTRVLGDLLLAQRALGDYDGALARAQKAIRRKAKDPYLLNNAGILNQELGRMEEAAGLFRQALRLDPAFTSAHANLVGCQRYADCDHPDIRAMERLLDKGMGPEERANVHFALGKACNDCGDYAAAFEHYRQGNLLTPVRFDVKAFRRGMQAEMKVYDKAFFASRKEFGSDSTVPIFIIGMPRSGTTLVEQVLATHPRVVGAGERRELGTIPHRLPGETDCREEYPYCVRHATADQVQGLADWYLERIRQGAEGADHIVDKSMGHFAILGLVALMFPHARIVHVVRNPLDTCLSCYFQNFSARPDWAFDLETLGRYYRYYRELMAHWREVLPVPVLDLSYEALTADQEMQSRALFEFCGLDWDPRCLRFHQTERPVQTASSWQVRQPLYKASVDRWVQYAAHLQPLVDALGDVVAPDADKLESVGLKVRRRHKLLASLRRW